jgi:hypothetical protein
MESAGTRACEKQGVMMTRHGIPWQAQKDLPGPRAPYTEALGVGWGLKKRPGHFYPRGNQ